MDIFLVKGMEVVIFGLGIGRMVVDRCFVE